MENNKLLAEYLGLPYKNVWRPDQDWNELMLVVEKIEKNNAEMQITTDLILIIDHFGIENLYPVRCYNTKIEAVYNACVEYVKSK